MKGVATLVALASLLALVASQPSALAKPAAQEARNLTVLAGFGQDTLDVQSFFPQTIRIRAGDTITWKQNSDAPHTVSFFGAFPGPADPNLFTTPGERLVPSGNLPVPGRPDVNMLNPLQVWPYPAGASGSTYRGGEFVSSGRFIAVPPTPGVDPIDTFSLTFDRPGSYGYICLTHRGTMVGTVEVADPSLLTASAAAIPTQAEIDAEAQTQIGTMAALVERQRAQQNLKTDPGPNDTSFWYVQAGPNYFRIGDTRANLDEFLPKYVTVTSGDTVVWASNGGHAVTFNPSPLIRRNLILETLPDGSPAVVQDPVVYDPTKPTAVFDPTKYYVSGDLNRVRPGGTAWALTFQTPGTFEYYCAIHRERGMVGNVTVVARQG